jgi:hypothetical protein
VSAGQPKLPDEQGINDAMDEISAGVPEGVVGPGSRKRLMTEVETIACFNKHARWSKVRLGAQINPNDPGSCPPIHPTKMKALLKVVCN